MCIKVMSEIIGSVCFKCRIRFSRLHLPQTHKLYFKIILFGEKHTPKHPRLAIHESWLCVHLFVQIPTVVGLDKLTDTRPNNRRPSKRK